MASCPATAFAHRATHRSGALAASPENPRGFSRRNARWFLSAARSRTALALRDSGRKQWLVRRKPEGLPRPGACDAEPHVVVLVRRAVVVAVRRREVAGVVVPVAAADHPRLASRLSPVHPRKIQRPSTAQRKPQLCACFACAIHARTVTMKSAGPLKRAFSSRLSRKYLSESTFAESQRDSVIQPGVGTTPGRGLYVLTTRKGLWRFDARPCHNHCLGSVCISSSPRRGGSHGCVTELCGRLSTDTSGRR